MDLALGTASDRRELYDFIQARGLTVENLARTHGGPMRWDNFIRNVPGVVKKPG